MSTGAGDSAYALLTDGTTIEIRPAQPGDFDAVRDMHVKMSSDNLYLRFFSMGSAAAHQAGRRHLRHHPAAQTSGLPDLIRFRRLIGLFAFFYVCFHFTTYIWLDQGFDFAAIWKDVLKRPYITAGFTGFVLLIPLAITSTKGWIRRMGGKNWARLHKLVYATAIAGVIHYYWLVKSDVCIPLRCTPHWWRCCLATGCS